MDKQIENEKKNSESTSRSSQENANTLDLAYLASLSAILAEMKEEEEVFEFLAQKLKEHYPRTIILINKSNPEGTWLKLVKIIGLEHRIVYKLISWIGFDPVGKSYKVTEEFRNLLKKPKMYRYDGDFYKFSNNEISETIAGLIEKSLRIKEINTIAVADQGQFFGFIHFLSTPDSEVLNHSLLESVVYLCFLSLARINSVKNLEERDKQYKLLADNVRDIIFTLDLDLKYTYISPSVKNMRGYEPYELIGESIAKSLSPASYNFIQKIFATELEKIRTGVGKLLDEQLFEVELNHKDGSTIWTEIKASFIRDSTKKPIGVLGVSRNITERKIAEKELLKKNIELHEAVAQKDKLFSIIAHDLKSPFGHILNFSSLLKDHYEHYTEEKRIQFIELINKSSHQIYLLLENLLDWSRSQGGRMDFFPQEVKLERIVHDVTELLSHTASSKHIEIRKNIASNVIVWADDFMLKTILRNLVGNALKFTSDYGHVYIEAAEEKNEFVISVIDDGIGMDYALSSSLFNFDLNMSKPGTRGERGTGLGLMLCKEFVDRHGGKIWARSSPGQGSIFSFTLPKL